MATLAATSKRILHLCFWEFLLEVRTPPRITQQFNR
jgi:hypothetical protein